MKKRVLSLLLACFMVVSTFIISKPLVHVHAVDENFEEGVNMWTLPTDWSHGKVETYMGWDIPKQGQWQLGGYYNVDKAIPVTNEKTVERPTPGSSWSQATMPWPYLATLDNEKVTQKNANLSSGYGATGWYVNYDYRWNGVAFKPCKAGDDYVMGVVAHNGQNNVVTFTAPKNGVYSYSETVEQVLFVAAATNLSFEVTVRKNGAILDSFITSEENKTVSFDGEVFLAEGDLLMFAFKQVTSIKFANTQTEHKENDPLCLKASNVVVKLVTEYADAGESYELPRTWLNCTETDENGWSLAKQGQWFLTHDGNLNGTASTGLRSDWTSGDPTKSPRPWYNGGANVAGVSSWYINPGTRWDGVTIFNMETEGKNIRVIPSASYNPAVVFTAPETGVYYYGEMFQGVDFWDKEKNTTYDGMIDRDGKPVEVLATVEVNGAAVDAFVVNDANRDGNLQGTVALNAGDKLAFVFDLTSGATIRNHDKFLLLNGAYAVKIADYELPANYKGEVDLPLTFNFDASSTAPFKDKYGVLELVGYHRDNGVYRDGFKIVMSGDEWFMVDSKFGSTANLRTWGGAVNGAIAYTGGHHQAEGQTKADGIGAAAIFTAPEAGAYKITAKFRTNWIASRSMTDDYIIQNADGIALAKASCSKNQTYTTITASVYLEAGESAMIIRVPQDTAKENISNESLAELSIVALTHYCTANTLVAVDAVEAGCFDGAVAHYACYCGATYADANAANALDSVVVPGTGHATPETWGQSETEHWKYCANGCDTLVYANEAHTWANGACTVCEYECVHTWNAETGICTNCGLGCTHTVTENDANCQADAVCEKCGYTYKNPTNHVSNEFTYTEIDGVTHKVAYKCCGTEAPDGDCVYGNDNICDNCGYDKTVEVETEDVKNAIDNILNGGTADVTVVGPTTGMDANFDIEKPATTPADYEFKYLNIYFDENDNVVLRMTFIVTGEVTVTLNNNEATLKQDDGYNTYYLDVTPVAGEYDVANVVTVNGDTYNVSLYSYIKLALEGEVDLTDAEETLLRALYDLNEAMR